ncbi:DNA polymerase family B-domain-containing protein [Cladochytrium replicatum]|nr:DNA polymerase family B-domain-containing protein [Cladochytrium replicatum]
MEHTERREPRRTRGKKLEKVSSLVSEFRSFKNGGAASNGSSRRSKEWNEDVKMFDVVDEDDYDRIRRQKQEDGDDFVVDDDGKGYADYGQDEWAEKASELTDNGDSDDEGAGNRKRTEVKRKRSAIRDKPVKPEQRIDNWLSKGQPQSHALQTTLMPMKQPSAPPVSIKSEDDYLAAIFGNLDEEKEEKARKRMKQKGSTGTYPTSSIASAYRYSSITPQALPTSPKRPPNQATSKPNVPIQNGLTSRAEDFTNVYGVDILDGDYFDTTSHSDPPQAANSKEENPTAVEPETSKIEEDDLEEENVLGSKFVFKSLNTQKPSRVAKEHGADDEDGIAVPKFAPKPVAVIAPPVSAKGEPQKSTVVSEGIRAGCKDWATVRRQTTMTAGTGDQAMTSSGDTNEILEEDGSLFLYWIDACEIQGTVYLFGKVLSKKDNRYMSCCVAVENMMRNLFVLPRELKVKSGHVTDEDVTMKEVNDELQNIFDKFNIKDAGVRVVERKYAFEQAEVPATSEYMKVVYPFSEPQLPAGLSGETFSQIFGINTSPLELLIRKRKFMGPSWLHCKAVARAEHPVSWCKLEFVVEKPKSIFVAKPDEKGNIAREQPPPLVVMSLSMQVRMNLERHINEIVTVSGIVYPEVSIDDLGSQSQTAYGFTFVRQLDGIPWPVGFEEAIARQQTHFEVHTNERALLGHLLGMIHKYDPDVVVGHNIVGFGLDVLLHRMRDTKTEHWSKIGRLRRRHFPKLQQGAGGMGDATFAERQVASGRLLLDTYLAAKENIRAKSYSLSHLAATELRIIRTEIDFDRLRDYFFNTQALLKMVEACEGDAYLAAALMFKLQYIPLSKQLTNLAGNLWSKTLASSRADRNEYLLLHEFHNRKFIVPDKYWRDNTKSNGKKKGKDDDEAVDFVEDEADDADQRRPGTTGRRKPAYAGGLVLEPKKGFYDKFVVLLDFNSLYPSIIQEFNICFTTVQRGENHVSEDGMPNVPDADCEKGVLPRILATLVQRRREVKKLMKDPKIPPNQRMQYDIRQMALKLTANSMYGCLGFSQSRFYAKPLAMLVTAKGREILQSTVDLATENNMEVIYGDTDSIMIHTHSEDLAEVRKLGNGLKELVNKRYRLLELELDHIYKRMLLLKKKKYAGLAVVSSRVDGGATILETSLETKGLDLVRRDWCGLSQDVSGYVLNLLFDEKTSREDILDQIHHYLQTVGEEVRQDRVPIEKYAINKSLTKKPEEYADGKTQPHVQVAIKMRAKGAAVRVGDTISFVICMDAGTDDVLSGGLAGRAFNVADVASDRDKFKIDFEWYLANQVYPPIQRLLEPIEGSDPVRLAEMLGLDANKYQNAINSSSISAEPSRLRSFEEGQDASAKYRNVESWAPKCLACKQNNPIQGIVRFKDGKLSSIFECECGARMNTGWLRDQIRVYMKALITKFSLSEMKNVCTDCGVRSLDASVYGDSCPACGGSYTRQYTKADLIHQAQYLQHLFDPAQMENGVNPSLKIKDNQLLRDEALAIVRRDSSELQKLRNQVRLYSQSNDLNFWSTKLFCQYLVEVMDHQTGKKSAQIKAKLWK